MTIGDIEADALSTAMQAGISYLDGLRGEYGERGWDSAIRRRQYAGRVALDSGRVDRAVEELDLAGPNDLATNLAALAYQHGGIRIAGIVFCAAHSPGGRLSPYHYACRTCDPDSEHGRRIDRTVITVTNEGLL